MKLIVCYFDTHGDYSIKHNGIVSYGDNKYGLRMVVPDSAVTDTLERLHESISTSDGGTETFIRAWFKQLNIEHQRTGTASQTMGGCYGKSRIHIQNITEAEASLFAPHTQTYVNKYIAILDGLSAATDMSDTLVHFCAVSQVPEDTLDGIIELLKSDKKGGN